MLKGIIDSDILSEISKGYDQNVLNKATAYLHVHARFTFTSISVYEVLYGLNAKPALQQARRFLQLISSHDEIVPEAEDYRLAAEIRAALHHGGKEIGKADPVIAACAYRRNLALVIIEHMIVSEFALLALNHRNPHAFDFGNQTK